MKPISIKYIVLCADDYGLNAAISQGIIDLLHRQRLSAVSCLTTSPLWAEHALWLKPFGQKADLGLHFNLTEGKALSREYQEAYGEQFFSLPCLILKAFLGHFDISILEQECQAQLNRFIAELGFMPCFIDGHQHIHQLPGVRDALIRVYNQSLRQYHAYLRSTVDTVSGLGVRSKIKQFIIYHCGALGFEQILKQESIPHNSVFAGIYPFSQADRYAEIFPYFLNQIKDKGLIMCHPACQGGDDAIAKARFQEYRYLSGEQFKKDCQALGVEVRRFL